MSQSDTDDKDVDEALEDAVISYVNMDARENGALSCRPQGRLRWIKEHQSDIRPELYQGLQDALHVGETNAKNIGKRIILPSSFIGGRRDMTQRYEAGMAIVLNGDRPDLLTRIFRSKFKQLKDDVINKGVLGKVKSYMYVTKFQKRGLSHLHMLLVLESDDKLCDPKDYNSMDLNELLNLHGKKIEDYDLTFLPPNTIDIDAIPSIIQEELTVDIPNEGIAYVAKLNNDQMIAFKTIMNVIVQKYNRIFFVNGPGGTCKTFLYRTLMASLRSRGEIILATASSGIAATLLPSGRTAHSRFKIPIDIQPSSICGIQKQNDLANLIRVAAAII
ncbi:hypothetical protein KIW84_020869 [Lathyrus oleraceus]|uniref:ATP-dependent DNA helicase n=1 Tax=Pisum sativum TaxID=3888 RepID=A0A9D4Y695_PEA|nr:hypothetical protein KIW84_020869 [Pisum sativum]